MLDDYIKPDTGFTRPYQLNREKWDKSLEDVKRNPSLMMKRALDYLADNTNGVLEYVDASNPSSLLMEFSAQLAANNFNYFAEMDRRHYPSLATHMTDLYPHMSLALYNGIYSTPSVAKFLLQYRVSDIQRHAVPTNVPGQRMILIPRGTAIDVEGAIFTLLHGIEIRINDYNAIQVIYNTDKLDTLEPLKTNILDYLFVTNHDGEEWLRIEVPLLQVAKTTYMEGLSHLVNPYMRVHGFTDKFVKARVYLVREDGTQEEIKTTHSVLVYNPNEPTAVITVLDDNNLSIHIPMIYYSNETVKQAQVKVEVYTTQGKVHIPVESITASSQQALPLQYEKDDLTVDESRFSAPLEIMDVMAVGISDTSGGRDPVSFDTMKKWVINAGRYEGEAITHANIRIKKAGILGYDLITDIDHVTNRIFQATREIEPAPNGEFTRGVGCSIESVPLKLSELETNEFVNVHGDRMTLRPDALFKTVGGVTKLLNKAEIPTEASAGGVDAYIQRINTLEYIKTPFHYVFDASRTSFDMRPYYMLDPSYISQSFVQANQECDLLMAVYSASIHYTDFGYRIRVRFRGNDELKKVDHDKLFVQLAYIPAGQIDYAYLNGDFVGIKENDHVFEFDIKTTFDFDEKHHVMLNNFHILSKEARILPANLTQAFRVVMGIFDHPQGSDERNHINKRAGVFLLEGRVNYTIIAENEIRVRFGDNLNSLWHNTRTTSSLIEYAVHEEDVPLRYAEDVRVIDEATGLPKYTLDAEGRMVFELAHQRGDIIRDVNGKIMLKHQKGDVMTDEKGNPVPKSPKQVLRIADIFFYDGIYHFSNYRGDMEYIRSIPRLIVNWLEGDVHRLQRNLLEQSELFFMPKRTMGYINIIAEGGIRRSIFNRLPFKVTFYLTDKAWRNNLLRESIRKMTYRVINEMLTHRTVSKDIIENTLRTQGGTENVLGVNINDMGLGPDVNTFTMIDDGARCSVRRKIGLTEDNHLRVREDIEITFINHDRRIGVQQ